MSFVTIFVCNPWYVPSRVTSRHHLIIVSTVMIAPVPNNRSSYWWNHLISPIKVTIAPVAPVRNHILLFTIWNGWFSCIDSAPYSYLIHLVLTVYNPGNCQRHRNISSPSRKRWKELRRCQNHRNCSTYVTHYQLNIYVCHTLPTEHLCTSHVTNWTLMYVTCYQLNTYVRHTLPNEHFCTSHITNWTHMYVTHYQLNTYVRHTLPTEHLCTSHITNWTLMYVTRYQLNTYVSHITNWKLMYVTHYQLNTYVRHTMPTEHLCTSHVTNWTLMYVTRYQLNTYVRHTLPTEHLFTSHVTNWTLM